MTLYEQENSPAQPGGEADDGSITSTEERQQSSSPLRTFIPIIKL